MNNNTNTKNSVANAVTAILDKVLVVEANTTSCSVIYQPKAPEKLATFRNTK